MTKIMSSYVFDSNSIGKDFLEYLKLKYKHSKIIIAVPADEKAIESLGKDEQAKLQSRLNEEHDGSTFHTKDGTKYLITGAIEVITNALPGKGKNQGPQALIDPGIKITH
jgi:hypothetical protein